MGGFRYEDTEPDVYLWLKPEMHHYLHLLI